MKKISSILLLLLISISLFSQTGNTGTLKIFTELQGITVFVDENPQTNYQEIKNLTTGTHYVRVMSGDTKVYGQIVTIVKDQVTSVLIEQSNQVSPKQTVTQPVGQKPVEVTQSQNNNKSGTLNIFSEISGISVYLNDIKQGDDIKTINGVPAGNHYLKAMKDGVSIFGELVTVNEGQTTTVLIKNNGQVAEKIMEGKVKEREEYNSSKIDVLFASKSITETKGSSTLFPGYYGYWGYSNSISATTAIPDFKIIKGGVQEVGDVYLAELVQNKAILDQNAKDNLRQKKMANTGAGIFLGSLVIGGTLLADMLVKKPFLHPVGTTAPNWEIATVSTCLVTGIISYGIVMASDKTHPAHYYSVQNAAKDAQDYNKKLKEKLGLPESYDVK